MKCTFYTSEIYLDVEQSTKNDKSLLYFTSNCSGVLQRLAVRDGMGENKSPYAYRDSSSPGREELGVVCMGLRESVLVELGRAWGNGTGLDTTVEFSSRMYFVFHFFKGAVTSVG